MTKPRHEYKPDYAVPPGATLAEVMEWNLLSKEGFAKALDIKPAELEALLVGDFPIDAALAHSLEGVSNIRAVVWNNLERNYRATKERLSNDRD